MPYTVQYWLRHSRVKANPSPTASQAALRWQTAYFSLKALSRLTARQPALLSSAACAPLWAHARPLLLHSHAWLRGAMGRAVGSLLASLEPAVLAAEPGAPHGLGGAGALVELADALSTQLTSKLVTEPAAAQVP